MKTYYAVLRGSQFCIHDAESGAQHFNISVDDGLASYQVNGNTFTVCYNTGKVEIYDLDNCRRIR